MAIYSVCDNDANVNVTITSAWYGSPQSRNYNQGDCIINETTRTLRITASQSVDTDYAIWYTYTQETQLNFDTPETFTLTSNVEMLAHRSFVDVEVLTYQRSQCAGDGSGIPMAQ